MEERGGDTQEIKLISISKFMLENNIDEIDLLKLNCEGSEYDIIKDLINSGFIHKIKNLQVQFHDISNDSENRMKNLQAKLSKTHYLTYEYTFVWENWKRKNAED